MTDSTNDFLRPGQVSSLLGLKSRQTARVLAELEACGYKLSSGGMGARRCPPELAHAAKQARDEQRDLLTLRFDATLNKFLRRGRAAEPDALEVLIETAAEVALVREVGAALAEGARLALPLAYRAPDWAGLGLPDPRGDL